MRNKRRTYRRKAAKRRNPVRIGLIFLVALTVLLGGMKLVHTGFFSNAYIEVEGIDAHRPQMEVDLITPNSYSRPQTKTERIKNIVIHYTANPGSTAQQNRDYFDGLKDTHLTKASSHFVVGLDGEIVQCIPTWEVAYASNDRNKDTVSIECCHLDETGKFNDATYQSLVHLSAWLCMKFDLSEEDLIRHYDVTGKICPKYFVDYPEKWDEFRSDVGKVLENMK
ncbi:peptidoglycan recognition family protein [Sellimonas caecigallum]|uniref:N-acetylmuramoyl-L-alanine amidase n=1 Tax=Sellimonas caecigallum TaxID=2592333 RepID=A0ABS7L3C1_9FIRM|nr:peptidoglycan recognition family protein [Sellimonas caecigallum]MBY0757549.1 N-acetylmuramoyl-L-alanine amidase [Sellimonas caecigallum]OUP65051.1 N-acetylmuramoyl-L-alanine amidase [Drancourtella sp. An177]